MPALNAVFMVLTQRLTPTTGMDPMQAKMMKAMPVVFSIMFAFFPAGLVLYWQPHKRRGWEHSSAPVLMKHVC